MVSKKKPSLHAVPSAGAPPKVEQMLAEAAESEAQRFVEGFSSIQSRCESPIEEMLMVALYIANGISEHELVFMGSLPVREPFVDETAYVYQQASIGPYRADILIVDQTLPFEFGPARMMIVECDGHDFHERTKAQARRDKQRDRFFQSKGFKVLRFTGSEIWADPDKCADEIINELCCNDDWRNREK